MAVSLGFGPYGKQGFALMDPGIGKIQQQIAANKAAQAGVGSAGQVSGGWNPGNIQSQMTGGTPSPSAQAQAGVGSAGQISGGWNAGNIQNKMTGGPMTPTALDEAKLKANGMSSYAGNALQSFNNGGFGPLYAGLNTAAGNALQSFNNGGVGPLYAGLNTAAGNALQSFNNGGVQAAPGMTSSTIFDYAPGYGPSGGGYIPMASRPGGGGAPAPAPAPGSRITSSGEFSYGGGFARPEEVARTIGPRTLAGPAAAAAAAARPPISPQGAVNRRHAAVVRNRYTV